MEKTEKTFKNGTNYQNQLNQEESLHTYVFYQKMMSLFPEEFINCTNWKLIANDNQRLIYRVFNDSKTIQKTVIISGSKTEPGFIRSEYDKLLLASCVDSSLVPTPRCYYSDGTKEAYIMPYYEDSYQIIMKNYNYGFHNHNTKDFIEFTKDQRYKTIVAMVASLIRGYNENRKTGISGIDFTTGDYILDSKTIYQSGIQVAKNIKIIRFEKLVQMELLEYIKILKNELVLPQEDNLIVKGNIEPLCDYEVRDGILLGLDMKNK